MPKDVQIVIGLVLGMSVMVLIPMGWEMAGYWITDLIDWWKSRRKR
jgi:hypothetical protein